MSEIFNGPYFSCFRFLVIDSTETNMQESGGLRSGGRGRGSGANWSEWKSCFEMLCLKNRLSKMSFMSTCLLLLFPSFLYYVLRNYKPRLKISKMWKPKIQNLRWNYPPRGQFKKNMKRLKCLFWKQNGISATRNLRLWRATTLKT